MNLQTGWTRVGMVTVLLLWLLALVSLPAGAQEGSPFTITVTSDPPADNQVILHITYKVEAIVDLAVEGVKVYYYLPPKEQLTWSGASAEPSGEDNDENQRSRKYWDIDAGDYAGGEIDVYLQVVEGATLDGVEHLVVVAGKVNGEDKSDRATVSAPGVQERVAGLEISELVVDPVKAQPGDIVNVRVSYSNADVVAENVQLQVRVAPGLVYQRGAPTTPGEPADGEYVWPLGALDPGVALGISLEFVVQEGVAEGALGITATLVTDTSVADQANLEQQTELVVSMEHREPDFHAEVEVLPVTVGSGRAGIRIIFWNDGGWAQIFTLRLVHPDSLKVLKSEPNEWEQWAFDEGYTWVIPETDMRTGVHELEVFLEVAPRYSVGEVVEVRFYRTFPGTEEADEVGERARLPLDQKEKLASAVVVPAETPVPSPLPVSTAVDTPSIILSKDSAMPVSDVPELPIETTTPTPSPTPEGDGETGMGTIVLFGAALVVVIVLIVGLLYLVTRRKSAVAPAPGGPFLVLVGDPKRRYAVSAPQYAIGRAVDNNLVIDENFANWDTVSRHHAVISQQGGQFIIEDQNSQNGIKVRGRPTVKNLLRDGWQVTIGGIDFTFYSETPDEGQGGG